MKKYVLTILLFVLILNFSFCSYAINMNLFEEQENNNETEIVEAVIVDESNTSLDSLLQEESENSIENTINDNENSNVPTSTVKSTSTNENFFTAENIINVILIAIGIVLIFLAIAILIRIK